MSSTPITAKERYTKIVEEFLGHPDVTQSKKRGFGSGLRVNNKVFAMLVKDKLVVKLPQQRVEELITSGGGGPYEHDQGRVMKEWVTVDTAAEERWMPLALEAMEYVAAKE